MKRDFKTILGTSVCLSVSFTKKVFFQSDCICCWNVDKIASIPRKPICMTLNANTKICFENWNIVFLEFKGWGFRAAKNHFWQFRLDLRFRCKSYLHTCTELIVGKITFCLAEIFWICHLKNAILTLVHLRDLWSNLQNL